MNKAELFRSMHELKLKNFRAVDVVRAKIPGTPETAKLMGHLLRKLRGQTHAELTLIGQYSSDRRTWFYNIIEAQSGKSAADAVPAPSPPDRFREIVVTELDPAKERLQSGSPAFNKWKMRDSDGREIDNPLNPLNPLNPFATREIVGPSRHQLETIGVDFFGATAGLDAGLELMEKTVLMAGGARAIVTKSWHERGCDVLGCEYDTFC